MSLLYKGLPFKTDWVEYPDIEHTLKRLGAPPTGKKPDGSDAYTLPAIYDDSTGRYISDSLKIAEYLDETYPDTPRLFPPGTRAAIELLQFHFSQTVAGPLFRLVISPTCVNLNPRSEEYFRRTREATFKCKIEEISPAGPKRDEGWAKVKEGLSTLDQLLSTNGKDAQSYLENTFSFADAIVVSYLLWAKIVLDENEEWQALEGWDNGRWARLLASTKEYQAVLD